MAANNGKPELEDTGRDLAKWLQEAGRRRPGATVGSEVLVPARPRFKLRPAERALIKQTTLLASLVAAYLQYFYVTVMLEIAAMPSVIVFAMVR